MGRATAALRSLDFMVFAPSAVLVVLVAALVALYPAVGLGAALVLPGLALLVAKAWARLLAVVFGALLVFQSASDAPKLAYLAAALLCVALSLVNLLRDPSPTVAAFQPMLAASTAMVGVIAVSYLIATSEGVLAGNWFRDMLPYLLMAILPLVGLDASRSLSPRFLAGFIAVFGIVAAVAFAVDWLSRRGATTGGGRILLATAAFSAFAFAYAFVRAGVGPHRLRWLVVAVIIAAALLITGTRTNIVIMAAVVLGALGSARKARVPLGRMLAIMVPGAMATALVLPILSSAWLTNTAFLSSRMTALTQVLSGDLAADQSFQMRAISYAYAKEQWAEHPWFGGGPGYLYPTGTFWLDTPWLVPAKFGIVGTAVLLWLLFAIARSIIRSRWVRDPFFTTGRAWAFSLVVLLPFGPWTEDKGAALAMTVLVAGCASVSRRAEQADNAATAPSAESTTGAVAPVKL